MPAKKYSCRARAEMILYQSAFAPVSLISAPAIPVLAKTTERVNKGFNNYLGNLTKPDKKPVFWVHGVSMGEALVAEGFAKELKASFPDCFLFFTSTHPDVIKNVVRKRIADSSAYFPLDTFFTMKRAFERVNPDAVFIAETDFWPVFSCMCFRKNIPLILINGRISHKIATFYHYAKGLSEVVFSAFTRLFVQTKTDFDRLIFLGVNQRKIKVVGNIKADLIGSPRGFDPNVFLNWKNNRKLLIFGSLHPYEFSFLMPVFRTLLSNNNALLIAPRNLKNCNAWKGLLEKQGISVCLKTESDSNALPKSDVMLLDTMGELASVYSIADVAMIGGTIDETTGGHNPLEIICHSVPLVSGKNFRNFADIFEQLLCSNGALVCKTTDEFIDSFTKILDDSDYAQNMALQAFRVLESNRGALKATIKSVTEELRISVQGKIPVDAV
jgi:3-deoxy-D-manno-octulosonic-acid transferase